jgi:Leucine-rich repeat (LRR) protein
MTPDEAAYERVLRSILKAEKTGAVKLDLRYFSLNRLPPELARLTSLQSLNLSWCKQLSELPPLARLTSLRSLDLSGCRLSGDLSPLARLGSLQTLNLSECEQLSGDLSPLARLTSLQSLNLSRCRQLSGKLSPLADLTSLQSLDLSWCAQLSGDLSPLARLTSLQSLNLAYCLGIRRFAPLESLLPTLEELRLFGCKFDDLPSEVCGDPGENVLDKVRAHYKDLSPANRSTRRSRSCSSATAEQVKHSFVAGCAICHLIRVSLPPTGFNSAK